MNLSFLKHSRLPRAVQLRCTKHVMQRSFASVPNAQGAAQADGHPKVQPSDMMDAQARKAQRVMELFERLRIVRSMIEEDVVDTCNVVEEKLDKERLAWKLNALEAKLNSLSATRYSIVSDPRI